MDMRSFAFTCLLAWSFGLTTASAEGRLAAARREVSGDDDRSGDRDRDDDHDDSHHHHHYAHWPYRTSSYFQCVNACQPPIDQPPPPRYASYPYATSTSPYLLEAELQVAASAPTSDLDARLYVEHEHGRRWAGQLTLDGGYLNGVAHTTFDARVLTPGPTEVSLRHQHLFEPSVRDQNAFGGFDFGVRMLETPHLLLRGYIGFVYFGLVEALDLGAELGLGIDAFIARPFVLSARIGGALVREAVLTQARLQLGYLFGRVELFAGYELFYVGAVNLSAPFLGTRLWL